MPRPCHRFCSNLLKIWFFLERVWLIMSYVFLFIFDDFRAYKTFEKHWFLIRNAKRILACFLLIKNHARTSNYITVLTSCFLENNNQKTLKTSNPCGMCRTSWGPMFGKLRCFFCYVHHVSYRSLLTLSEITFHWFWFCFSFCFCHGIFSDAAWRLPYSGDGLGAFTHFVLVWVWLRKAGVASGRL